MTQAQSAAQTLTQALHFESLTTPAMCAQNASSFESWMFKSHGITCILPRRSKAFKSRAVDVSISKSTSDERRQAIENVAANQEEHIENFQGAMECWYRGYEEWRQQVIIAEAMAKEAKLVRFLCLECGCENDKDSRQPLVCEVCGEEKVQDFARQKRHVPEQIVPREEKRNRNPGTLDMTMASSEGKSFWCPEQLADMEGDQCFFSGHNLQREGRRQRSSEHGAFEMTMALSREKDFWCPELQHKA
jgi:hypothetical protein